jgi:hypothetical protein
MGSLGHGQAIGLYLINHFYSEVDWDVPRYRIFAEDFNLCAVFHSTPYMNYFSRANLQDDSLPLIGCITLSADIEKLFVYFILLLVYDGGVSYFSIQCHPANIFIY